MPSLNMGSSSKRSSKTARLTALCTDAQIDEAIDVFCTLTRKREAIKVDSFNNLSTE